jgi:hypothetical protein
MEKPDGEIFIIPARLEECDSLESLSKWHWVDLFEDDGYKMLTRALRARANRIGIIEELEGQESDWNTFSSSTMMNKITLNQKIEIINSAVSEHLSDMVGDFIFDLIDDTNTTKRYHLWHYIDPNNGWGPVVSYDGSPLYGQDIDDLGWINLRALSSETTELRISTGFAEEKFPQFTDADKADAVIRIETKKKIVEELIERLRKDGFENPTQSAQTKRTSKSTTININGSVSGTIVVGDNNDANN